MKWLSTLLIAGLVSTTSACLAQSVSGPKSVQLTVYNGNFALVKDIREISLNKGTNSIEVSDVASKINATSVLFKPLTVPDSVSILEQNYQYDLINSANILRKSVGQRVIVTNFDESGKPYSQSGILMNQSDYDSSRSYYTSYTNDPVIKTDDGRLILHPSGEISLDKIPEGLHTKPTLNWILKSNTAGKQNAEISYITDGLNWNADYVVLLNEDDTSFDLNGWVTLDNKSGASYNDAKLALMAGDVKRVKNDVYGASYRMMNAGDSVTGSTAPQFEASGFSEYHMYTMERPTTIRDNETKQLSLLNASNISMKKELIYDPREKWWKSWWNPDHMSYFSGDEYDTSDYHKVNVVIEAQNTKANHVGMPLPKGKVRVYKLDGAGSQQFVGEDVIDHTPKDEKIRLCIGNSFDVVGDYKRTAYDKISQKSISETFQTDIRNHKDVAVEVKIVEHVWADWNVVKTTNDYTKKDAHTIEFLVKVPANGGTQVVYTIKTNW